MKKQYNPKLIEKKIYSLWEKNNFFKPNYKKNVKSFCIMMPPPNVTGSLHMGHAFQQTLMDILIRYNRMKGKNTLWQFGTDHAGIATQILVENNIKKKKNRLFEEYSKVELIQSAWKWTKKTKKNITDQIKRLGCSVDWSRERFTLDSKISIAVQEAFIKLYKNKLIYKKKRLVNWDVKLKTVISDLEVEHREVHKKFWYIKYPIFDNNNIIKPSLHKFITIATTRPETMIGDVAIAINPLDKKNNHFIGKKAIVPIINKVIPIIADSSIDIEKGTGCVKITPGHDFNDYSIGIKNKLPIINIFSSSGRILKKPQVYTFYGKKNNNESFQIPSFLHNLNIVQSRKTIIQKIINLGLLKTTKCILGLEAYSDRSGSIIEPVLKTQWYLKVSSLSKTAILAVKKNKIQIYPKQYKNMYYSWMNNIQDWCISRQLWWGHRIPVWYDKEKNEYVGKNEKEIRKNYSISNDIHLSQDKDVLDTWFSSALWTFATLGWPENTNDLKMFHSTNVLISGFDIIFFWIARMIMLTLFFVKDQNGNPQVPFKKLYITGLIKDEEGIKMSKSKGNVIDPIDMIDGISLKNLIFKRTSHLIKSNLFHKICKFTKKKFPNGIEPTGTDALRYTFASIASNNRFINWDMNILKGYRNFCNKLWNASRFTMQNINPSSLKIRKKNTKNNIFILNKWIMIEFNNLIKNYTFHLNQFRFDLISQLLYDFTWNVFCDWYIELSKILIKNNSLNDIKRIETEKTLFNTLKNLLVLLHPIIPFITESIWKELCIFENISFTSIMLEPFPRFNNSLFEEKTITTMQYFKNFSDSIRRIRLELGIKKSKKICIYIQLNNIQEEKMIKIHYDYIFKFLNLSSIQVTKKNKNLNMYIKKFYNNITFFIPIKYKENQKKDISFIQNRLKSLTLKIEQIKKKLSNKNFLKKAPKNIILKEKIHLTKLKNEKKLY